MTTRIDQLLVNRQLAHSRTQAQRLIEHGRVQVHEQGQWRTLTKRSEKLANDCELRVEEDQQDRYVSRGALKLEAALQWLALAHPPQRALDVGQSTGGFTDCLLQYGVAEVVGVEVGHDQLHPRLRDDPRVTTFEGINARHLKADQLGSAGEQPFDLIVMDVSFISQRLILPQLPALLRAGGHLISLVKPQFELGREFLGKGGIVRDESRYPLLEQELREFLQPLGLQVLDYQPSPICGGDGNREFLLLARYQPPSAA